MHPDVLVVEDDPSVRKLFMDLMEDEGYSARGACNGWEALEECERQLPDLVLLDLRMPELDGYSMLKEIDRRGWPPFPVVVVSGNATIANGLGSRVTDALQKPVDLDVLCQAAMRALGQRAEQQTTAPRLASA